MTETILNILLQGTKIFSDERRRYFSKKLLELQQSVEREEGKRFPERNDDKLAIARKELNMFLTAYEKEYEKSLTELIATRVLNNE